MKSLLLYISAAALIFTSCSQQQTPEVNIDNASMVAFDVYTGKVQSKAASTTNSTFTDFTVYGYQSSSTIDWSSAAPSELMSDISVSRTDTSDDDSWTTSSSVLWPSSGTNVIFYAYSPASAASYSAAVSDGPVLAFTQDTDNSSQSDLIVAKSSDIVALESGLNTRVPLSFTHALSKISFQVKVASNLMVYITEVAIDEVYSSGTYNFDAASWSGQDDKAEFAIVVNSTATGGIDATSYTSITDTDGAIMIIPQSLSAWETTDSGNTSENCRLKIVYELVNTSDSSTIVAAGTEAYLPMALDVSLNGQYSINLEFGNGGSDSGGGGYYDDGTPVIDNSNIISFSTTFTDWDSETSLDTQM